VCRSWLRFHCQFGDESSVQVTARDRRLDLLNLLMIGPRQCDRARLEHGLPSNSAVEIVFTSEMEARAYARDRSTDFRVLAASVTRFTIGSLGTRHPVAWFIEGREQSQREPRPGSFYPTDGSPVLRSL
jgi:hypothetical protein